MKYCSAISITQLLALVCAASAMFEFENTRRLSGQGRPLRKLLQNARRLDEANGDDDDDADNGEVNEADMEAFLMDYSMKFMSCIPDQVLTDADYNDHFGVVIFRLCPSNKCSDDNGCKSGYADFAVDIGTYVDAYLTDQGDNMNWDDQFDGDNFGSCTEFEAQNGDDDNSVYYVGPGCMADGAGLQMSLFEDQYCYQQSTVSFETISNGWSLPYSTGGLVSTQCNDCTDDDGGMREMCLDLYDYSPYRCEAEFNFKHYYYDTNFEMYRYGEDTTGCTKINVMQNPRSTFSQEAVWTDAILAVMLLVVTAAGYAWYSTWWQKQKENLEKIEDDDDSQAYHLEGEGAEDDDLDGDYVSGDDRDNNVNDDVNESKESGYEGGELT